MQLRNHRIIYDFIIIENVSLEKCNKYDANICLPIPNGLETGAETKFSSFLVWPVDARREWSIPFNSVLRSVTLSERVTFRESIEVSDLMICK